MWDKLKRNFISGSVFYREFLLLEFLAVIIILLLIENHSLYIPLILLITSVVLLVIVLTGKRRNREFDEVGDTISNIRGNIYSDPGQIKLNRRLPVLESEIKKMFEKMRNDIEYLKKLEKMRTEFLANVSHELRTPIFAVQGYIETLLNGALNDSSVNYSFLEKANRHTLNLNSLLNDLIDISMIESGEMRFSFRYFNINEFLEPVVADYIPVAADKKLDLVFYPAKENLLVYGDRNKLRQVLTNLIQNAVKYTEAGKIEIIVREEKSFAEIVVKDTGIGIPEQDINRIFERFYRVDKTRSRDEGGTGLGLAIVKHIVEAHGSKIEVVSSPGKGSRFSFRLKK